MSFLQYIFLSSDCSIFAVCLSSVLWRHYALQLCLCHLSDNIYMLGNQKKWFLHRPPYTNFDPWSPYKMFRH